MSPSLPDYRHVSPSPPNFSILIIVSRCAPEFFGRTLLTISMIVSPQRLRPVDTALGFPNHLLFSSTCWHPYVESVLQLLRYTNSGSILMGTSIRTIHTIYLCGHTSNIWRCVMRNFWHTVFGSPEGALVRVHKCITWGLPKTCQKSRIADRPISDVVSTWMFNHFLRWVWAFASRMSAPCVEPRLWLCRIVNLFESLQWTIRALH